MPPHGSAKWPRLGHTLGESWWSCSPSSPPRRPCHNLFRAPAPARVSAGQSPPRLVTISCHHRGWRLSAPKQLLPLVRCSPTIAARCLTPRSSRAPTAGHAGPVGGTLYIFANRARASHRWCRLNSNVRRHKPPRWESTGKPEVLASADCSSLGQKGEILAVPVCQRRSTQRRSVCTSSHDLPRFR